MPTKATHSPCFISKESLFITYSLSVALSPYDAGLISSHFNPFSSSLVNDPVNSDLTVSSEDMLLSSTNVVLLPSQGLFSYSFLSLVTF